MLKNILVVDDDEVSRQLLQEVLCQEGYRVELAADGDAAVLHLSTTQFSVVLTDIRMARVNGIEVLRQAKKLSDPPVVILMTGFGSLDGAIEAIQDGGFDYVSKPFRMEDLKTIVSRALKHWETRRQLKPLGSSHTPILHAKSLRGRSSKMVEVYKTLARASMSSSTVLVSGESGTGKELVARAIHDNSPRRGKRFVAINCGALAETLLESELFGHVKGSFTGAVLDKKGLFEEASGGTLFLDEIGDIGPVLQVKLLRVLQESEVKPVGGSENRAVDVRLIGATHRDLEARVREGLFREDLFYRLKVITLELPPLRQRMEDLPDLAENFLAVYAEKNKKSISHISEEAIQRLKAYSWPGNIRELEHAIERAIAMTNTSVLFPEDFPAEIARNVGPTSPWTSLEEMEKSHIVKVLAEVHYNKSKASEILGIDRATLYRKVEKYGIEASGL